MTFQQRYKVVLDAVGEVLARQGFDLSEDNDAHLVRATVLATLHVLAGTPRD